MIVQPSAQIPFADLPEGTVTFLFTDIEGSTRLLGSLRERYADLLADHHRLLREIFAHWHGHEVDTQGDSFFVAFSRATQAVSAAVEAQRKLHNHAWPQGVTVRVRMGIHTGEPWSGEEGYVGMDVHRAARIANVGHGGQVLLSEAAAALAQDELPEGVSTLDLGRHLLKDLNRPEHICQLVIEGLPSEFPPLTSLEALPPASARSPRKVGACPYRGLAAFQEPDAPFYFGREAFVEALEQAIRTRQLVAVIVGSSGSGKSSALFAGLLPRLRKRGGFQFATFRPGTQPFYALAGALLPLLEPGLSETDRLIETRKLAESISNGGLSLTEVAERILEKRHLEAKLPGLSARTGPRESSLLSSSRLLLVVDQFEELYTLCPDEGQQTAFIDQLLRVVEAAKTRRDGLAVILLTLRADFMGQALAHRPFADALQEASLLMGPMNRQELHLAIEKPAELQGAAFEPGLVERILDDVGEKPGNLPLLEFTLTQLWEQQTDGWLAHADYEGMGCVEGALAAYADRVFEDLDESEQALAHHALVQLVQPGEGTEDTRRIATHEELGDESWEVVQRLADRRLVVTGRDAQGRETAEVVHEALIQKWGRFQEWMRSDRAFRLWQERLRGNLRQWQESKRDEGALLRGAPLAVAQSWLAEREQNLNEVEAGYIRQSQSLQTRQQNERQRRRQRTLAGLAIGLVIALVLVAVVFFQRQDALRQAAILLAGQAESELADGYHDRAVLLALAALENYPYTPQAEHALGQTVSYNRLRLQYLGHQSGVTSLAWSPDGKRVASTGSNENNVRIWDPNTGETLLVIDMPKGITGNKVDMALSVRWTPDGERLVTLTGDRYWLGSQDFDLIVWDASSGKKLSSVEIPNQAIPESGDQATTVRHFPTGDSINIDPTSGRLATLGGDNTALIWDKDFQTLQLTLVGHTEDVNSVAWSPDGSQLITASLDGTARTWDGETGKELLVLRGHTGRVNHALWSPDGSTIATVGGDETARLWDTSSGELLRTIETNAGIIWTLAWSPDGARLVTGHEDASLHIWEVASGTPLETLRGQTGFISHMAWSPLDQRLASADSTEMVRIWNAAVSPALVTTPYQGVGNIQISHDGQHVALFDAYRLTPVEEDSLAIWDMNAGEPVIDHLTPQVPNWWELGAYSPDDQKLIVVGPIPPGGFTVPGREVVYVFDSWTGELIKTISVGDNETEFRSIAWSPDGSQIATGLYLGEIIIWDYQTGKPITRLLHNDLGKMIGDVEWSPDGDKFASASDDSTAKVWDAHTWKLLYVLQHEPPTAVIAVEWSPDGSRLLTGSGNPDTGAKDNTARIWDSETGRQLLVIPGHSRFINSVDWSPDGSRVITASYDGTTRVWDASSGAELLSLSTPNQFFCWVRWSPDGQRLVTGGYGLSPAIWRMWQSKEELIEYAKECCVIRELTPEELKQFGLE